MKKIKIYLPFLTSVFQRMLSFRINFFMFTFGGFLETFIIFYLWKAIFISSGKNMIEGFSLNDMLIYVFMSGMIVRLVNSRVVRDVGEEIRDGSIAMNLIKPISYRGRHLFQAIGHSLFQFIFIGIPLWIGVELYRGLVLKENMIGLVTIFYFLISVILSFLLMFFLNFCVGILAFFVINIWGLNHLKGTVISFLSGELIPIAFFPLWAKGVMKYLPFSSINYTPVMIYLEKYQGNIMLEKIFLQLFWVIIMFVISNLLWKKSISRLTVQGG
ncbi:ABC transporter permease [Haliovirga abyssi]|uniref:Antibiotic ABC transporter permease n=1 Tax=Haliovirga abyssi TaxID=2996794 RepID=A0AAU9DRD8_9FUSO|nr:ABC-2 family transporter protein [Haliovirga abyssi]BDU49494.1 antibiotic ABC transporter permease [Haliovirga abyssi]